MQPEVPALFTVRRGVGDAFSIIRPPHLIALFLHDLDEILLGLGVLHRIVYGDGEGNLPALALVSRAILRCRHGLYLSVNRLNDSQSIFKTQLIRGISQLLNLIFVRMVLVSCVRIDRIDDEVRVDMRLVNVSSHQNFVALELFRGEFHGYFVSGFGRDGFVGGEGLQQMIEHSAAVLPVKQLGADEFLVARRGKTVDSADQFPVAEGRFFFSLTVIQDEGQPCAALHFAVGDEFNRCHPTIFSFQAGRKGSD